MIAKRKRKATCPKPGLNKGSVLVIGNRLIPGLQPARLSVEEVSSEAEAEPAMRKRRFDAVTLVNSPSALRFIGSNGWVYPNTQFFLVPGEEEKDQDVQSFLTEVRRTKEQVPALTIVKEDDLATALCRHFGKAILVEEASPEVRKPSPITDNVCLKPGDVLGGVRLGKKIGSGGFANGVGGVFFGQNALAPRELFAFKVLVY